eukprot:Gb_30751 [translate_table: standard]
MKLPMAGISGFIGRRPWRLSFFFPQTIQISLLDQPHVAGSIPGIARFSLSSVPSSNPSTRRGSFRLYASLKEPSCQVQKKRRRLDEICVERFPQYSRSMIQSWILQGKVLVDGRVAGKAGMPVSNKAIVEITAEVPKYV